MNSRKPSQRELSGCPSSGAFFRNQGVSPEKERVREGQANCLDGVKAVMWKRNRLTLQRSRGQAFNQGHPGGRFYLNKGKDFPTITAAPVVEGLPQKAVRERPMSAACTPQ